MSLLPVPEQDALQLSQQLKQIIAKSIEAENGSISFSRFMQLALYEPGLGYYSAGSAKFGIYGDFTTAPETSSLFGRCFSHQISQIFFHLDQIEKIEKTILEFGAGSGRLACDMLTELEKLDSLPDSYFILEVSADLRQRQQQLIQKEIPHLESRVSWLETLPSKKISGVILANEVLDAMPVDRFLSMNNTLLEQRVAIQNNEFIFINENASDLLIRNVANLEIDLPDNYSSEINQTLPVWFKSLNDAIETGVIFCVDYGYSRHDYYHPDQNNGTLICHYRHQAHDDPFVYIGLQDISASVDFTSVAEAAFAGGFEVAGYTTQAHFLINNNLISFLPTEEFDSTEYLKLSQEVKMLTLPAEMGERFKVIGLTKQFDESLVSFETNNLLERL
ncbi:MAG: class I SAM-dependent methyltransferase [Gammaproteobacteria bacterium]